MKALIMTLCFLVLAAPAFSQETLNTTFYKSGSFGNGVVKFSSIDGNVGFLLGGYGGNMFNKKYFAGGGGFVLLNKSDKYGMLYGGTFLEYIKNSEKLRHYSAGTLIGIGLIENKDKSTGSKTVFVLEPEFKYMMNINEGFRSGIGVSYRLVLGAGSSNSLFSGLCINLNFRFGKFSN